MQSLNLSIIALLSCLTTHCLSSAILSQNSNNTAVPGNSRGIISRRQDFVSFQHYPVLYPQVPSNLYYSTPGLFQTAIGTSSPNGVQLHPATPSLSIPEIHKLKKQGKTKVEEDDDSVEEKSENSKSSSKKNRKKNRKKNKKPNLKASNGTVESKGISELGTERGCPACVSGTCDATLDPSTNISGIPIIQIIIACAVGAFWAGIFIFFLLNFIEHDKEGGGGYGYSPAPAPQYGTSYSYGTPPASEYGSPTTGYSQSSYNTNRIAYNRYGRAASSGFSTNEVSRWVWNALEKFVSLYDSDD